MTRTLPERARPPFETPSILEAGRPRRRSDHTVSLLLCLYFSILVVVVFALMSTRILHWFVFPLIMCGSVIGMDAVPWIRGRVDLFDPVGILGVLGYYFFLLAPLLVVYWDYRIMYLPIQPEDYRNWLGGMAILNFLGLLVYRVSRRALRRKKRNAAVTTWRIDARRFGVFAAIGLVISGILQVWIYVAYGGFSGYMAAYTSWLAGAESFKGTLWLFSISESFPILAMIGFAVSLRRMKSRKTWTLLAIALALFFALQMIFGGLRGSRSNTIWGLFWAAGIVHLYIRRLPRVIPYFGLPLLFVFMYLYGFYKEAGPDAIKLLEGSEGRAVLAQKTRRSPEVVMLSDFSRSDVQAFLLYRLLTSPKEYRYALGRTYLGALALLAPRPLWPDRPPGKVKWTTEAEYGIGTFGVGRLQSSRVYGLAGEAMLNFGPAVVPLSFALLGFIVGFVRRALRGLPPSDSRLLLLPFLINFCILFLLNDSDIHVVYFIKYGAIPFTLVMLASRKHLISQALPACATR